MSAAATATITLAELFRRSARIFANRPAIAWEGGEMTYAELDRRTDRLANALAGLGYCDGSRIAVLSETRPEFCELRGDLVRRPTTPDQVVQTTNA